MSISRRIPATKSNHSSLIVREISFDRFWMHSRYRQHIPGVNLKNAIFSNLEGLNFCFWLDEKHELKRGFYTCIECTSGGSEVLGNMVLFKDPRYVSLKRHDVGCFGLITVKNGLALKRMLNHARRYFKKHGVRAIRGPVNIPRSLLGYGLQISGFDEKIIAGSASDPISYKLFFDDLFNAGFFSRRDVYYNYLQDFTKTQEYIEEMEKIHGPLDRDFEIRTPLFDELEDLPGKVAKLMNETLGYRPDYSLATEDSLRSAAKQYKLIPDGQKLIGLFFKGDELIGGVIQQPDWFQLLRGERVNQFIGDIYMLSKKYQGKHFFMNCLEYTMSSISGLNAKYFEHASIWKGTKAILSCVKNGYARIIKSYVVHELKA
ncbi:MAG: hypothetical protein ACTSVI_10675 [Promethearchaeota archaeon]